MQFEAALMEDVPSLSMSRQSSFESDFCRTPSDADIGYTTLGRFAASDSGFFKALEAGLIAKGSFASLPELCKDEKLTVAVPVAHKPDIEAGVAPPNATIAADNCIFSCESLSPAGVYTVTSNDKPTLPSAPVQATTFDFNFRDGFKREFVDLLSAFSDDKYVTKEVCTIIENEKDECATPPNTPIQATFPEISFDAECRFARLLHASLDEKFGPPESEQEKRARLERLSLGNKSTGLYALNRPLGLDHLKDSSTLFGFDSHILFDDYKSQLKATGLANLATWKRLMSLSEASEDSNELLMIATPFYTGEFNSEFDFEEHHPRVLDCTKTAVADDRFFNRTLNQFASYAHAFAGAYESDEEEESLEYEEVKVIGKEDLCSGGLELFDHLEDFEEDILVL